MQQIWPWSQVATYRRSLRVDWREATRLWQRANIQDPALIRQWQELEQDVQQALQATSSALLEQTSQRLHQFAKQHLQAFRRPASVEYVLSFGSAILIALCLRAFVMEPFRIPSGSMIPTLAIGDQIFVNKFVYGLRVPFTTWRLVGTPNISRGEVFVFIAPPKPKDDYIKRVIAVAGDRVEVRRGQIILNKQPIEQHYLGRRTIADKPSDEWLSLEVDAFQEQLGQSTYVVLRDPRRFPRDMAELLVPEGHVFVMGDNRDHSSDSREWGMVPTSFAVGRAICVWWSWGEHGLQWRRLWQMIE